MLIDNIIRTLYWLDEVENNSINETDWFNREFLGFSEISASELDYIVLYVNIYACTNGLKTRVNWNAGEIRPVTDDQRIAIIDKSLLDDLTRQIYSQ